MKAEQRENRRWARAAWLTLLLLAAMPWACGGTSAPAKAAGEPTAATTSTSSPEPSASAAPAPPEQAPVGPTKETSPAAAAPAEATESKVVLVAAGKDPKAELRYAPKVDQRSTLTMAMELGMTMKLGEKEAPAIALPKIVLEMTTHVTSVAPDGTISYEFHGTSAKAIGAPGVKPDVLAKIQGEIAKVSGIKGNAVVDSHGYARDVQIEMPPDLDPSVQQMADSVRSSLRQILNPLPEEPVGIGAKWDAEHRLPMAGTFMKQIAHSTLIARNGSKYSLAIELEQSAVPQALQLPNLPQGTQAKLVSLVGKGKGELKGDLARVTPIAWTMTLESRSTIEVSQGGESHPLSSSMTLKMDMKSR